MRYMRNCISLISLVVGFVLSGSAFSQTLTANQKALRDAQSASGSPVAQPAPASGSAATDIAEIQPGDRTLTCGQIQIQLNQMNNIALHGVAGTASSNSGSSAMIAAGKSAAANTALSHIGSIAGTAIGPLSAIGSSIFGHRAAKKATQDAEADATLRQSAQRRHDRLMQLYDQKHCD